VDGVGHALAGLRLMTRPGVRRYVLVPLAINALLFATAIVLAGGWIGALLESWLPPWLALLEWLLWPLFILLALLVVFFSFTFVANLIGAPFNGPLAAAVETALGEAPGETSPGWAQLCAEGAGAVLSELRKIAYLAVRAIPLVVLSLIPGLQPLAALAWFAFGAWALSIEYADYPLGNHGLGFAEQRALLAAHRPVALGFGAAVTALTLIPVLNFVAMPAAVAGATSLWVGTLREAWRDRLDGPERTP